MKALLTALLLSAPAYADPLGLVDYDALIATHLAEAEEMRDGNRLIRMDHGVEMIVSPEGTLVYSRDRSAALGCLMTGLAELSAAARICPGAMTPGRVDGVDTAIAALIPVYAAGVAPVPATEAEVADGFEALVTAQMRDNALCDLSDHAIFLLHFVNNDNGRARLAEMLATPRLPVDTPCF